MTGDTDCVPAMKHPRKAGVQVVLLELPNGKSALSLRQHADYVRLVPRPDAVVG